MLVTKYYVWKEKRKGMKEKRERGEEIRVWMVDNSRDAITDRVIGTDDIQE